MNIFQKAGMVNTTPPKEPEAVDGVILQGIPEISKEEIKAALPAQLRTKVSDSLVDKLNAISMDPDIAREIRENFVGFNNIMKDGKFKFEDYLSACAYVTYKMMGYSNQNAYGYTFPDRIARLRAEGKEDKHISAFVASYNKNKLVNMIMEQALIPTYLLNQDLYQEALQHQAYLMTHAQSEKVQCDAAKSILDALKQPETSKIEIDVAVKDNSGIDELKRVMVDVAKNQASQIKDGAQTKQIAHQELFDSEGEKIDVAAE